MRLRFPLLFLFLGIVIHATAQSQAQSGPEVYSPALGNIFSDADGQYKHLRRNYNIVNANFKDVVLALAMQAGIDFIFPEVLGKVKETEKITVQMYEVAPLTALTRILETQKLRLMEQSDSIFTIEPNRVLRSYNLRYLTVTDVKGAIDIIKKRLHDDDVTVSERPSSNSGPDRDQLAYMVLASPAFHDMFVVFLEEYDKPERQILLECEVIQISSNPVYEIGIDWSAVFRISDVLVALNVTNGSLESSFLSGTSDLVEPAISIGGSATGTILRTVVETLPELAAGGAALGWITRERDEQVAGIDEIIQTYKDSSTSTLHIINAERGQYGPLGYVLTPSVSNAFLLTGTDGNGNPYSQQLTVSELNNLLSTFSGGNSFSLHEREISLDENRSLLLSNDISAAFTAANFQNPQLVMVKDSLVSHYKNSNVFDLSWNKVLIGPATNPDAFTRVNTAFNNALQERDKKIAESVNKKNTITSTYHEKIEEARTAQDKFKKYNKTLDDGQVSAVVQALKATGNTNVITNPRLVVRSGKTTNINVGDQFPYTAIGRSLDNDGTIASTSIEYIDTGLDLEMTPHLVDSNQVHIEMRLKLSSYMGEKVVDPSGLTAPRKSVQDLTSQFWVPNGKTLMIGGLVVDGLNETKRQVPVLGQLPFVGRLFQYERTDKLRSSLVILITPHVFDAAQAFETYLDSESRKARQRVHNYKTPVISFDQQ